MDLITNITSKLISSIDKDSLIGTTKTSEILGMSPFYFKKTLELLEIKPKEFVVVDKNGRAIINKKITYEEAIQIMNYIIPIYNIDKIKRID